MSLIITLSIYQLFLHISPSLTQLNEEGENRRHLRACTTGPLTRPFVAVFSKEPCRSLETQPPSSREATDLSRAPIRRRRSEQRCTSHLPVSMMRRSRALARAIEFGRAGEAALAPNSSPYTYPGEVGRLSSILLLCRHPIFGSTVGTVSRHSEKGGISVEVGSLYAKH